MRCKHLKPAPTVYVATGYTVVPFLRAQHYIKTQMQCMSFFYVCISTKGVSTLVILKWCV